MNRIFKNISYRPILLEQIKHYNKETFICDLRSGLIVAVVALPLGIAFGIASGVTPQQGILSCIIGGLFASIFGGSKFQITGPTGALIITISSIIATNGYEGLAIATFVSGILLILMGLFKVGSIIKFIPYPIIIGFTSGIAVVILSTQLNDFFGLGIENVPSNFISKLAVYVSNTESINWITTCISILTIILIWLSLKISKRIPAYLVTIVIISFLTYILERYFDITTITTIGDKFELSSQLPETRDIGLTVDSVRNLFSASITLAIFGSIVSLLSSTVADGLASENHDPNSELVGQGIANMVSPIIGGVPITGAIARTVTNVNNGGKTPIAGVIHALVLILILLFLGSLTSYIPLSCLAGILVVVSYNMSDWRTFISLLKMPAGDVAVLLATFFLTIIFDLTIAIEVGMVLAVISFVRRISNTTTISVTQNTLTSEDVETKKEDVIKLPKGVDVYEIEGPFFFGIANKFNDINKIVGKKPKVRIIRMRKVPLMDSTGIHNLELLYSKSRSEKIEVILSGVNSNVLLALEKSGFATIIGEDHIKDNIYDAVNMARDIVEREKQIKPNLLQ